MGSEGYSFIRVKPTSARSNIKVPFFASRPSADERLGGIQTRIFWPTVIICSASARPGMVGFS